MPCPLCLSESSHPYFEDKRRLYLQCSRCDLVFVPKSVQITESEERAEYEKHQNNPNDHGYRRFLSRVAEPLLKVLPEGSSGMDFGCGPGPTLSRMLEEHGHRVKLFDKYFYADQSVWESAYDFVSATEVVEHLRKPKQELERLWQLIKPGGVLAIMTKLVIDQQAFQTWHYKNDPTHICFFSMDTLSHLAKNWGAELTVYANDAFIFQKPCGPQ